MQIDISVPELQVPVNEMTCFGLDTEQIGKCPLFMCFLLLRTLGTLFIRKFSLELSAELGTDCSVSLSG